MGFPFDDSSAERTMRSGRQLTNWAGNYRYSTDKAGHPHSMEKVRSYVRIGWCRALGTRHCFNGIADNPQHALLSLKPMDRVVSLDP